MAQHSSTGGLPVSVFAKQGVLSKQDTTSSTSPKTSKDPSFENLDLRMNDAGIGWGIILSLTSFFNQGAFSLCPLAFANAINPYKRDPPVQIPCAGAQEFMQQQAPQFVPPPPGAAPAAPGQVPVWQQQQQDGGPPEALITRG